MMKLIKRFPLLLFFLLINGQPDTLTIMNYNILRFNGNSSQRAEYIKTVIDYVKPDLIVLEEIEDQSGINLLLNDFLNKDSEVFAAGPLPNSQWMKSGIIYNKSKLDLTSYKFIPTVLRDISGYTLSIKNAHENVSPFTVFGAHLKASNGSYESEQRWKEAKELHKYISQMNSDYHYILAGDFNVYGPDEPAYKLLVDSMSIDLEDPIGYWSRNESSHVEKYTQSTRNDQLSDGGASGGLDDRFDFILLSDHFTSKDPDLKYVEGSYKVIGNDGNHFNKSITDGANSVVSASIAEAIYFGSDHYPVVAKVIFTGKNSTSPVAHAGGDQVAAIDDIVYLNGSESYDPNGSIINYEWSQTSGPKVNIENSQLVKANFVVPQINRTTSFIFRLKITDNENETSMDYVKISVPIVGGYTPYNIQFAKEKGVGDDCYPSSFEGQTLEVTGVVTAVRPDQQYPNFFFQDPIKKEWGGMFVYVNEGYSPPKIGDLIKLKGDIVEYYGMTEMKNIVSTTVLSSDNSVDPLLSNAISISGGCSQVAEKYEGVLVRVPNLIIVESGDERWRAVDNTGSVFIDSYLFEGTWPKPEEGTVYISVTGIVHYTYGEYKLMPRNKYDFNVPLAGLPQIPDDFELLINYPNPFNPTTTIEFKVRGDNPINLNIFDIYGHKVATLINGIPSSNKLIWNGKNNQGRVVPAGIYFARLESGNTIMNKKMIILK